MKEKWNQMKFYEETVNAGKQPSFSCRKLHVSSQNFDSKIFHEKIKGKRDFIGFSSVKKAALCCQKGLLSQRAAEIVFNIPRPKIRQALQVMREDCEIGKRGQSTYLNPSQEQDLIDQIIQANPLEYPTQNKLVLMAQKMKPKLLHHFGLSWAKSFLKHHHKQLKAIFPQTVAEEQVISKKVITEWFEKHQELLESIDLRFLLNFDETMVAPGTQKFQVISLHDKKRVVKKVIQNKKHITLLQFI